MFCLFSNFHSTIVEIISPRSILDNLSQYVTRAELIVAYVTQNLVKDDFRCWSLRDLFPKKHQQLVQALLSVTALISVLSRHNQCNGFALNKHALHPMNSAHVWRYIAGFMFYLYLILTYFSSVWERQTLPLISQSFFINVLEVIFGSSESNLWKKKLKMYIGDLLGYRWVNLIYLSLDKMAAILQMIFSYAFLWMKCFVICFKFHWSLFLRVKLTITQHWLI